jgi:hypothetical protein
VLGVDRHDLARLGAREDDGAADDQRLLVGQRQGVARVERGERRPQTHGAGDAVEHHVALQRGRGAGRLLAEVGEGGGELVALAGEQVGVAATGRQRDHPEPVRVGPDHVERLGADGPRGPEDDHVASRAHGVHPARPRDAATNSRESSGSDLRFRHSGRTICLRSVAVGPCGRVRCPHD